MLWIAPHITIPAIEISFTAARSSGPGGQNVNKVNSKAVLRWDFQNSQALPPDVRERFLVRFGSRLTKNGEVIIASDRCRDLRSNQEDCLQKLREMILAIAVAPKIRKPTKPSFSSTVKRRKNKSNRGEIKKGRRRPTFDD